MVDFLLASRWRWLGTLPNYWRFMNRSLKFYQAAEGLDHGFIKTQNDSTHFKLVILILNGWDSSLFVKNRARWDAKGGNFGWKLLKEVWTYSQCCTSSCGHRRAGVSVQMYSTIPSSVRVLPQHFLVMNVQKVRWHGCVTRINSLMPMATSSIYVKHHFDHEAKKQVSRLVPEISSCVTRVVEWTVGPFGLDHLQFAVPFDGFQNRENFLSFHLRRATISVVIVVN